MTILKNEKEMIQVQDQLEKGNDPSLTQQYKDGHSDSDQDSTDTTSEEIAKPIKPKIILSPQRRKWLCCVWSLTWWIPTFFIRKCGRMTRREVQIAWREKVTLNIIILFACALLLFYIIGLGRLLCPKQNVLSQGELDGRKSLDKPYVSLYGSYYHIPPIVQSHVTENAWVNAQAMEDTTLGHDVSPMFFKTSHWSTYCPGFAQPSGWDTIDRTISEKAMPVWMFHQGKDSTGRVKDYISMMRFMKKGEMARDPGWIKNFLAEDPLTRFLIVLYGKVYDISTYLAPGSKANFLGDNMRKLFMTFGPSGGDATSFMEQLKKSEGPQKWSAIMRCMDGLLYTGVVDTRNSPACQFSNYMLLISTIVLVLIIGVKFLAALQCHSKRDPEDHDKFVICAVPCYTEGVESLKKTLESLALSKYDEKRKLFFIVADGMVTGGGNDEPTPDLLLKVLGWRGEDPEPQLFQSLGDGKRQLNRAKVYSGLYLVEGRYTPYIVVVKVGMEYETYKPGNRAHLQGGMSPLELMLYHHIKNIIGFQPEWFEFLLWVDADTEVFPDSINRMVSCFVSDGRMVGLCGETLIKNEGDSWVTMIQVYEYFISHHLAKAFESLFGSVTCLPGCFSMYRIKSSSKDEPIMIHKNLVEGYGVNKVDTLHMKNLLTLGEDRYLTTLVMKHFPGMRTCFTSDAKAYTVVPEKWSVLISQRRRWINSTFHNLWELLLLNELCGFCLFSMRFVVFLDLFATMVQPAGMVYVGYLIYSTIVDEEQVIPVVSLIMIGAIYGLQVIIFILKREWQHIGWMIIYILAMPLYSFYLPLYSFWQMDDFTWGNTRVVVGGGSSLAAKDKTMEEEEEEETVDIGQEIPLMTWEAFSEQSLSLAKWMHLSRSPPYKGT